VRLKATSDIWWKDAVVYSLDVGRFNGTLEGLTDRVDYLAGMGVSCLWLMPFYPSLRTVRIESDGPLVDLFADDELKPSRGRVEVPLGRYGARWFRVRRRGVPLPP
jgi:hypothetical protein